MRLVSLWALMVVSSNAYPIWTCWGLFEKSPYDNLSSALRQARASLGESPDDRNTLATYDLTVRYPTGNHARLWKEVSKSPHVHRQDGTCVLRFDPKDKKGLGLNLDSFAGLAHRENPASQHSHRFLESPLSLLRNVNASFAAIVAPTVRSFEKLASGQSKALKRGFVLTQRSKSENVTEYIVTKKGSQEILYYLEVLHGRNEIQIILPLANKTPVLTPANKTEFTDVAIVTIRLNRNSELRMTALQPLTQPTLQPLPQKTTPQHKTPLQDANSDLTRLKTRKARIEEDLRKTKVERGLNEIAKLEAITNSINDPITSFLALGLLAVPAMFIDYNFFNGHLSSTTDVGLFPPAIFSLIATPSYMRYRFRAQFSRADQQALNELNARHRQLEGDLKRIQERIETIQDRIETANRLLLQVGEVRNYFPAHPALQAFFRNHRSAMTGKERKDFLEMLASVERLGVDSDSLHDLAKQMEQEIDYNKALEIGRRLISNYTTRRLVQWRLVQSNSVTP